MEGISHLRIKSFAGILSEIRRFDTLLEELQESLYRSDCYKNERDYSVYVRAQMVRDYLFRLVRTMRGLPDETCVDDYDAGGGEVLRSGK